MTFKNRRKNTFKLYREVREDLQMNDSYYYFTYCILFIRYWHLVFRIQDRFRQNKTKQNKIKQSISKIQFTKPISGHNSNQTFLLIDFDSLIGGGGGGGGDPGMHQLEVVYNSSKIK